MSYEERTRRAMEVKELLENPRLVAALEQIESDAVERWKFSDKGELDKREECWRQYVSVQLLRGALMQAVEDGQMAEYDQKQKSL